MKLLTLNTHSLIEPEYEAKREIFVEFIAKEQPDVFALQEVNQTAAAPELKAVPAGYTSCPGNTVPLKADNHAAAVARMLEQKAFATIGAGSRPRSAMTDMMRAWPYSAVRPSRRPRICC